MLAVRPFVACAEAKTGDKGANIFCRYNAHLAD